MASDTNAAREVLEAWRMAYRAYTKYAADIRQAVALDDDSKDVMCGIFSAAAADMRAIYHKGGDAEIIAVGVYGMLTDVLRLTRESKQAAGVVPE